MSFETTDFDSALPVPELGGESIISEKFSALASRTAKFAQSGMEHKQVAILAGPTGTSVPLGPNPGTVGTTVHPGPPLS